MSFTESSTTDARPNSRFPQVGSLMIAAAARELEDDIRVRLSTIEVARDVQSQRDLDAKSVDRLLASSARLRSMADRLDSLVTGRGDATAAGNDPALFTRQLERYSQDLQTIRRERNAARNALKAARLEALQKLAAAAELKDNDTGEHVIRMGHYCGAIARALGTPPEFSETLLVASRMHDIGKIGIPDSILQKPGKLTDDEWVVMRTHPMIGATLLSDTDDPLFTLGAEVALFHHEKYDGSGYPTGIGGEDIPLSGRIVAVADFFDAITMDRCYRPAMPDEQALEMVRKESGRHFDPVVVEAFFRCLDEIVEIRRRVNSGELH